MTDIAMSNISFSICVPALNEEKSLVPSVTGLVRAFSGRVPKFEIIIVNDGSRDKTASIAGELARTHKNISVIHHEQSKGIGACYFDALKSARCDYYSWFPADGENDPNEFLACMPYVSPTNIVSCNHKGMDSRSLLRRALSSVYISVLNTVFGLRCVYYNGLTIYPTGLIKTFPGLSRGFFFNAENMILALKSGCTVKELAFPLFKRVHGRSHALRLRSIRTLSRDFIAFCFYYGSGRFARAVHEQKRKGDKYEIE